MTVCSGSLEIDLQRDKNINSIFYHDKYTVMLFKVHIKNYIVVCFISYLHY